MKCGAFDSGLTIHPDGKVTPCCQFDINLAKNINDLNWQDPWKDLRDGRGCTACKKPGKTYKNTFDNYVHSKFAVRWLDVRNNNLCNMECVICGPYYSSKWAERVGKEQSFVKTDFDVDFSQVRKIYFAGGEPFLNKTHWNILKNIPNPERVGLFYTSNLTYVKGVQEHFLKFKHVGINASLDGVGKFGEQIRPGLNWKTWQKNLDSLLNIKNVKVEIACTVGLTNIWHLEEIDSFAKQKGIPIEYFTLKHPDYLSLSALPIDLKEKINFIPTDELKLLINDDKSYLFKHTIANILLGDRLRETNLWDYLPFKDWAIKNILDY
jgi:MoaA/NifB/PqqE/SkfB family radical SAM enzyme